MKIDTEILLHGQEVIPYKDFESLAETVKRVYHFSAPEFWMWKMLQFGFVYGKRVERSKKRRQQDDISN